MLPHDISRCAGRRDWTAETDICPQRETCKRYLALQGPHGPRTPFTLWACDTPEFKSRIPLEAV